MKKLSILEDLIPLFPTSPFKIFLDNQNEQKNKCILSETFDLQYSNELRHEDQELTVIADISAFIEADEQNANFDSIYSLLLSFYQNVRGLEGQDLANKRVELVEQVKPFGYMGRDKVGNYTFVLNMTIQYKV
jgi:hypothetical protein